MSGQRRVSSDEIRQVLEQLSGKASPPPPPVARPPARKAEPPPPPTLEPATAEPVATQTVAAAPAQTSRALQWMEALRDRNNIRNIVIAAEIIGPPRAESV
jgi:hypothetical protein